jgi:hypothetical protein
VNRWAFIALLAVLVFVVLLALTSVRLGARETVSPAPAPEPERRTFVWVRGPDRNIGGAHVQFVDRVGDSWGFPLTNEGGWTKRAVPDGYYSVLVSADGWKTRRIRLHTPTRERYATRDFTVWMERVK